MLSAQRPRPWMVILAFGLVYLFWGSTYLGIDIAVQTIPPALMCGVRFSIAGTIMLAVCAVIGRRILYSPRQIALSGAARRGSSWESSDCSSWSGRSFNPAPWDTASFGLRSV